VNSKHRPWAPLGMHHGGMLNQPILYLHNHQHSPMSCLDIRHDDPAHGIVVLFLNTFYAITRFNFFQLKRYYDFAWSNVICSYFMSLYKLVRDIAGKLSSSDTALCILSTVGISCRNQMLCTCLRITFLAKLSYKSRTVSLTLFFTTRHAQPRPVFVWRVSQLELNRV